MLTAFFASLNAAQASPCALTQAPYQSDQKLPTHDEGYLNLSGGTMFYSYINQPNTPLVILAPGIPSATYYADLMIRLYNAGYSVLTFDYPGKMNSELRGKEDLNFISQQLKEAFQALNLSSHSVWHVMGTSMGGPVAAQIAVQNASFVRDVELLNPIGLDHNWSFVQKTARIPILNQILAPFILKKQVKKDIADAVACPANYGNLISEQDKSLATIRSRLNYLNLIAHFSLKNNSDSYRQLAQLKIPVLVTSGQTGFDPYYDQAQQLQQIIPDATYVTIQNTSHIPFIENPVATFEILKKFLKEPSHAVTVPLY